jgi:hypothetical protein
MVAQQSIRQPTDVWWLNSPFDNQRMYPCEPHRCGCPLTMREQQRSWRKGRPEDLQRVRKGLMRFGPPWLEGKGGAGVGGGLEESASREEGVVLKGDGQVHVRLGVGWVRRKSAQPRDLRFRHAMF